MDVALDEDAVITITRVDHPKATVRLCDLHAGGDYFQRLWLPIAGPSVVALVNRSQELAQRAGGQAEISAKDLAMSLGIPGRVPRGPVEPAQPDHDRRVFTKNSVLLKTLSRAHQFGLGRVHMGAHSLEFLVHNQVAPLGARQTARLPEFLRQDHWDAMGPVAARFGARGVDAGTLTDLGPGHPRPPAGDAGHRPPASEAAHRALTRLEHLRTGPAGPTVPTITPAASR